MDFDYTPEQQEFRGQVRSWLETTAAELFGNLLDSSSATVESLLYSHDDQLWEKMLTYHRRLHGAGYLALHWPKDWGGVKCVHAADLFAVAPGNRLRKRKRDAAQGFAPAR